MSERAWAAWRPSAQPAGPVHRPCGLLGVTLCHMGPRVSGCLVEMSPEPPSFSLLLSLSLSPLLRPSSDFRARSAPGTLHFYHDFYMRASSARSGLGLETPEGARIESSDLPFLPLVSFRPFR